MGRGIVGQIVDWVQDGTVIYDDVVRRCDGCGLSVRQLCLESGVSGSTLWRWKKGIRPETDTLVKLDNTLKKWEAF